MEAQSPGILPANRFWCPSIFPNLEKRTNPDPCHHFYIHLVWIPRHPTHQEGWQTSQMVSRHSLEVLDTVSHDEEQYIRAWSLFPTMSWGPAHTQRAIICWLGLLPVSRLQTGLLDLTPLHVSWHVLNASDSHYRCLGFPWLRDKNPDVDWKTGEIRWKKVEWWKLGKKATKLTWAQLVNLKLVEKQRKYPIVMIEDVVNHEEDQTTLYLIGTPLIQSSLPLKNKRTLKITHENYSPIPCLRFTGQWKVLPLEPIM